jgi:alkaline phosphatase D
MRFLHCKYVPARALHRVLVLLASLAALALPCGAPAAPPAVSVMHGPVDQSLFSLWVQTPAAARVAVEFHSETAPAQMRRLERATVEDDDFVAVLRLANLEPGTAYRYRLTVDGAEAGGGRFRTRALWQYRTDPPEATLAIGSCAYLNDGRFDRPGMPWGAEYGIFDAIAAKNPDAMLWLGDNVYFREPEWTSLEGMSARYRFHRELPELAGLWRGTHHYATWDDHDFGPNDADGSFIHKGAALQAFRRYWPNPSHGLPEVPGVFTQFALADAEVFVLDDRWYRHPNEYPKVPAKRLYGAQQMEWLKQALLSSRATFRIVAGGTQFWNRASRFESFQNYPDEARELLDWITERRIPGVVFVSGDRHFSQLLRLERGGTYPLFEFTSSPLTGGVATNPGDNERANPDLVDGTLLTQRSFGLVRLTGPKAARVLALEAYDAAGRLLWKREFKASELR